MDAQRGTSHLHRCLSGAELHWRTDGGGEGLGSQLRRQHAGLDVAQLHFLTSEQPVAIQRQAFHAEADVREGHPLASQPLQRERHAADAARRDQAGDERKGVNVRAHHGDIPGPLTYPLLDTGFEEGWSGQLDRYRQGDYAQPKDDQEPFQWPLLGRAATSCSARCRTCQSRCKPYLCWEREHLGELEERMQRRTLVRGLAAATLAIAAGDLAALTARGTRPHPSPSHPPLAGNLPPGPPRSPPQPVPLTDRTAIPPQPQVHQVIKRPLICREAWGALPPRAALVAHRIERLTIHHTGVIATDGTAGADRLRDFQRYHQRRGLADLAYHVFIDRAGNLLEGRRLSAAPDTFTAYDPTGHFTACLDGNFDEQAPTRAQLDALVDLLAWATERFGVSPATLRGHRAYAATRCPGASLQASITDDTLRRRIEERRAAARAELVPLCEWEDEAGP